MMATLRVVAQWLVRLEIVLLSLIYLYFVVTDQVPLIAFALIVSIWLARWWTTGRLTRTTRFDAPILVLLALLPVTYAVSIYAWQSQPKIFGVLLSIAFFYAIVNAIKTRRDLQWATIWLVVACAGIALAGLIGTDWAHDKIVSASIIYDQLPRFFQNIPRSIAGGFARNGVGGTLAFTTPFLFALVVAKREAKVLAGEQRSAGAEENSPPLLRSSAPLQILVIVTLLLSVITLALTQSRGGLLGTSVGLLAVAVWRDRRFVWLVVLGFVGIVISFALGYGDGLMGFILRMDAQSGTLASRLEVWQRGWMMVQDFPFTGIGIGTFNSVVHLMYPFFIASPDEVVAHAHNQFLQVAVDLGIFGLVAYIALLAAFVITAWQAFHVTKEKNIHALIVGLNCGILAHHVFGLTDAFILGTKPGIVMWIFFAFVASRAMTDDEGRADNVSVIGLPSLVER